MHHRLEIDSDIVKKNIEKTHHSKKFNISTRLRVIIFLKIRTSTRAVIQIYFCLDY